MKFCVDCVHCVQTSAFFQCDIPVREDPVLGPVGDDCKTARREGGRCGVEAKNFEPKKK